MAWNFYLNLESIALKSARDAAGMMTEDNRYPGLPDYYDAEAFTNNLQHGFVALVMVLSYLECVVNSTLRDCFGYSPDGKLMHSSLEAKLKVLSTIIKKNMSEYGTMILGRHFALQKPCATPWFITRRTKPARCLLLLRWVPGK